MDAHGASLVMRRRLAWNETDAAGHNHFSSAFRWMEEAEHELYRCLGFDADFVACLPRVHVEADYTARILFGEEITVRIQVVKVGDSSLTLHCTADKADGVRAATATLVVVHVSATTEGSVPWSDDDRSLLSRPVEFTLATNETSSMG